MVNWQEVLNDTGEDILVIAISVDTVAGAIAMQEECGISFDLVSDEQKTLAKSLGLLNPEDGKTYPATFVIGKKGVVYWAYVGTSVADRPTAEEVLQQVARIQKQYKEE